MHCGSIYIFRSACTEYHFIENVPDAVVVGGIVAAATIVCSTMINVFMSLKSISALQLHTLS